jgi:hypothetical protein
LAEDRVENAQSETPGDNAIGWRRYRMRVWPARKSA